MLYSVLYSKHMIGLALTPEQFTVLLRMVYIANTVANAHRDEDFLKDYDELEQYIFARAKESGFPGATLHHKIGNEAHHHPSPIFENDIELNTLLDEYDAHIALEVLAEKLAERDVEELHGPKANTRMSPKDYETLLHERMDEYEQIFLVDGLSRVYIEGLKKKNK